MALSYMPIFWATQVRLSNHDMNTVCIELHQFCNNLLRFSNNLIL
jgi:hypothetical protein